MWKLEIAVWWKIGWTLITASIQGRLSSPCFENRVPCWKTAGYLDKHSEWDEAM
jgi:hypothetical protein